MKKCIYMDTTISYDEKDYKEYCEEMEVEYDENDTDGFYEWCNMMREQEVDDFWTNLKYSKVKDHKCVVVGSLGLWNGRHDVQPLVVDSIEVAIRKCIGQSDDAKVIGTPSGIEVRAYHHDGINYFTIKVLSELGCKRADRYVNWGDNFNMGDYHNFANKSIDYLF